MTVTDIFVSLWKRKNIIAFFVAVAFLACHFCLLIRQTHTAAIYIKYTESGAVEGHSSNGAELDPYEITDSHIVSKALESIGATGASVGSVAQRIKVTPMISSAEQEKYNSWIDQFSNYENTEEEKPTPVYYRIEFKSNEGIKFARELLGALVEQYRDYYTERYAGFSDIAVVTEDVVNNADYLRFAELMRKQISDITSYLGTISGSDIDYRSPLTGYSLDDLADEYSLLLETEIVPLTKYILDTGVSKDAATLTAELKQDADTAQLKSEENAENAETEKELMLLYAKKNKEYVSTIMNDSDDYENQVRGDVERDKAYVRDFSTYDNLTFDYVDYAVNSANLLIDKDYINENLSKFGADAPGGDAPVSEISDIYQKYLRLYEITEETLDGYNEFKSGRVVLAVSGIRIGETLPELLYYTISVLLSLCLGIAYVVVYELIKRN